MSLAYTNMIRPHANRITREAELAAAGRGDFATLIASQLAWVVRVASFVARKYQFDDIDLLISAGNLALAECVRTYDSNQSKLSTYAYRKLYWAMLSEVRKDYRGLSASERLKASRGLKRTKLFGDDLPEIASDCDVVAESIRSEEASIVRQAIDSLPLREATLIKRRFFEGLTLLEIATLMGITKERVRQLETRAKQKLRDHLQALQ